MYLSSFQSPRLTTRLLTLDDVIPWQRFFEDEESMEFFPNPDGQTNSQRASYWIERQLQRYNENRYGLHALNLKTTGEFIGQCGLITQEVKGVSELEIGYHIFNEHRGNGYAPEAAKLFLEHALQNKLAPSVVSNIHVRNFNSMRVAEKNGFKKDGESLWMGKPVFVYRFS